MAASIHDTAVELLLASMSREAEQYDFEASFFITVPSPPLTTGIVARVYYDGPKLVRAALHVRGRGPAHLKYLAIDDIRSMLQSFVVANYWHIFREAELAPFAGSYADRLSPATKTLLARALTTSDLFSPRNELTLFPIVPLRVEASFSSAPFFFVAPQTSALQEQIPAGAQPSALQGGIFPPLANAINARFQPPRPGAWLGITSPAFKASNKMKCAILGALALTLASVLRHLFTGRAVFGGRFTIAQNGSSTHSGGEAHIPPLAYDIALTKADEGWLAILATKIVSNERNARRQMRALEYFYRAWPLDPSERFPVLCMSLDAIFSEASHATGSVLDGVRSLLGTHIHAERLRHLMELRGSVIHGGAPDVYDSKKYARYYDQYGDDPISDLELVVAQCLRLKVFNGALVEHPTPWAGDIAARRPARKGILDD